MVLAENLPIGLMSPEGPTASFLTTGIADGNDGTIYVSSDLTNDKRQMAR